MVTAAVAPADATIRKRAIARSVLTLVTISPARASARRFRAQEKAALGDDLLSRLDAIEHLDRVADPRPELHGPLGEATVLAFRRDIHDRPFSDRLDGAARHDGQSFASRRSKAQRHVHAETKLAIAVR